MPYAGVGRVDVFVQSAARPIPAKCRFFLWDLSLGGGSVMTSMPVAIQPGEKLRLTFEDTLSPYPDSVIAMAVWVRQDAFGFRFNRPQQSLLAWAKGTPVN